MGTVILFITSSVGIIHNNGKSDSGSSSSSISATASSLLPPSNNPANASHHCRKFILLHVHAGTVSDSLQHSHQPHQTHLPLRYHSHQHAPPRHHHHHHHHHSISVAIISTDPKQKRTQTHNVLQLLHSAPKLTGKQQGLC